MRRLKEIQAQHQSHFGDDGSLRKTAEAFAKELETEGIVVLENLLSAEQLEGMQQSFEARLSGIRWNNVEGYQKTERYRHMVEDVLLLDQGFVDLALHPLVKEILGSYLGTTYELTEAKGWKSLPTKRDFHGWHGDAWYDQSTATEIHREVKLAMYLTNVRSGAFNFIKGSHRQQHPRHVKNQEVESMVDARVLELTGTAGTAFLFDTSGIHRQGVPMLEPREAVFYNYHDPNVRLQPEDVDYYRYHPLLLNAAFLGNLSRDDQRILGFGNKANFQPAFRRQADVPFGLKLFNAGFNTQLRIRDFGQRVSARIKKQISG